MTPTHIRVQFDYQTSTHGAEESDEPYAWRGITTYDWFSVTGIEAVPAPQYRDLTVPFQVNPDQDYYLVYARYMTGDSFGSDERHEFVDLFTTIAAAQQCVRDLGHVVDYSTRYTRDDGTIIDTHIPWHGYFERLESIEVVTVRLA